MSRGIKRLVMECGPKFNIMDLRCEYECGRIEKKRIAMSDFYSLFKATAENDEEALYVRHREFKLPRECYDYAYNMNDWTTFRVAFIIPEERWMPFCYKNKLLGEEETRTYLVPMPEILLCADIVKGRLKEAYVFALLRNPEQSDGQAELVHYPYANVYENGRICFGQNYFEALTLSNSFEICKRFFCGINNNDLYKARKIGEIEKCSLEELLEMVDGTGEMPNGLLAPYRGKTVDAYLDTFMQNGKGQYF